MGLIRPLADSLINRIAAGEVVERPASVVKELVENSLDSGATSIAVTLAAGGKRSVLVRDDGSGMDRDDALLAVERHATSKLFEAGDLSTIRTLGFRGEALSSISAVSSFLLRTSVGGERGTEVEVRGGRIRSVRDVAGPRGTSIRVERLFFNVPARRKFLRTEATELSHIVRVVTRLALAHPAVGFRLEQQGRPLLQAEACEGRRERIAQIFGGELVDKLLPFAGNEPGLAVEGFAGRPLDALPRREGQHLLVNGRAVQDRTLWHAVSEAYDNTLPRGRFPMLFLFLEVDPDRVDVNVHPRKIEVRFSDTRRVHDLVRDSILASLSHRAVVPDLGDLRPAAASLRTSGAPRGWSGSHEMPLSRAGGGATSLGEPVAPRSCGPRSTPLPPSDAQPDLIQAAAALDDAPLALRQAAPLAQYRDSYIVAQDLEGLLLVDQHAAHERVIFERYLEEAGRNAVQVQPLLFPVTCDLAPDERVLFEEQKEELRRLGFVVEPFGSTTVKIEGVPALAAKLEPEAMLRELLGEAARARSAAADVDGLRHRLVTSAACQAAIKVNYPLTRETMQALLDDLFATVSPSTCPHGRPTIFRLSLDEIERAFRRR